MANGFANNLPAYLNDPDTLLPLPFTVSELTRQVSSWLVANEGATFNLFFGNMAGQSLYAVSLFPERSVVLPGRDIPEDLLRRFIWDNQDLLTDPRNSIGIWYSGTSDAIYLDIAVTLPQRAEAISLGKQYNQEAIYDLGQDKVLITGGTGEWQPGLPDETERLSPLQRHRKQDSGNG